MKSFHYQHLLGRYLFSLKSGYGTPAFDSGQRLIAPNCGIRVSSKVSHPDQLCSVEIFTVSKAYPKPEKKLVFHTPLPSDFRYLYPTGNPHSYQTLNEKKCCQFLHCLFTVEEIEMLQLKLELVDG